ncbi:GNAT family N-acetyltransferase [Halorubrum sp. Eb13]|uniref:GNAT family N-acetyltransferase n=1 Tax=Halorubrum sp. Eb13 TaxID=1383843 RepID=UPI000B99089F|nr:GNAT family N-acetyltransferase [Halorubrum sp. Eb13]OYR49285.1 GNAT family N-acetyltransferase [Halorubrum sp. Eb13]
MTAGLRLRTYDPRDEAAVWALHEWALRDAGVDPTDVPGTDDLSAVEASYLEAGGEFVVGVVDATDPSDGPAAPTNGLTGPADSSTDAAADAAEASETGLATRDGTLAAMGGYLPNRAGHGEERDRPGAAELHRMRVAPPYQRRGYGRALLRELERRAAAADFGTLLATTSTRQAAALEFYRAHGYEEAARSVAGAYELVHFEKEL